MAGESPDKTEQQKSSGTAAEERDPRFAVFRDPGADRNTDAESDVESESDAGADSGAGSGATSDTATAVFRPRLPEDARREPEAESTSAVREPEGASPEPDVESVPETASEPLRAPVTAYTASGEAATPPEGPEGAEAAESGTSPDTSDAETADAETADASASAAAQEPEAEPGAGDGRLRAAVAAWVDAAAEDKPKADTEDAGDDPLVRNRTPHRAPQQR
ncbi:hypothetical protein ACFWJY_29410 [Streptomyces anulatus]|uniref:hypothetical protein n=1 Tax=Streptomyces anulatus TaxID=1892 RepID=UPI003669F9EB